MRAPGDRRSFVSDSAVVARFDLVRRIRNRSALFTAFIGPLAMAVVFSLIVGGGSELHFHVGIADEDGSALSSQVVDGLMSDTSSGAGVVEFERLGDADAARAAVDDDDVDAAIVIPAGYGASVDSGRPEQLSILRDPAETIGAEVARAVAGSITGSIERVSLVANVSLAQDPTLDQQAVVAAARGAPPALIAQDVSMGAGEVSVGAYYGASMAVLFLFFTIGFAARSIVAERRTGTLARILSTPAHLSSVIAGKTAAVAVLGFAGFVTTWLVTTVGFGASWGSSPAVVVLMLATVLSVGGVSMLVASLARTEAQADTYTSAVAFVLAILGGNFIGPGAAPQLLRQLARFTPNGWALDAFTELSVDQARLTDVVPALVVLVVIGLVFGTAGVVLLDRRSAP